MKQTQLGRQKSELQQALYKQMEHSETSFRPCSFCLRLLCRCCFGKSFYGYVSGYVVPHIGQASLDTFRTIYRDCLDNLVCVNGGVGMAGVATRTIHLHKPRIFLVFGAVVPKRDLERHFFWYAESRTCYNQHSHSACSHCSDHDDFFSSFSCCGFSFPALSRMGQFRGGTQCHDMEDEPVIKRFAPTNASPESVATVSVNKGS